MSVKLDWTDNSSETGFSIERGTNGTTYTEIATVAAGIVTYTDATTNYGVTYYYRVRAFNGNQYSTYATATITTSTLPVTDLDSNSYTTVIIGTQEWTVENLLVTKYADNTAIANQTVDGTWAADTTGAYCLYNNDAPTGAIYGNLYNWYAVNNAKGLVHLTRNSVRETDWRIPTTTDWATLKAYIGGQTGGGGKLKETGTTHWTTPNTGATDTYGFKALGSGTRDDTGAFGSLTQTFAAWTSTADGVSTAWSFGAVYTTANSFDYNYNKAYGLAIRCVRDL